MRAHHDESNREISLRLALNYLDQGITVINKSLQLIAWNDRFVELLDFPEDLITDGISLEALFRFNSKRGEYGDGDVETLVGDRLELAARFQSHCFDRVRPNGTVIEVKGNPIDNGNGFVTVYTDVTIERQKQAVLKKTIARRSTALQREAEAHQNAIAVLEESQNCIRKITDS
ncbi:MAG: PAS-domain containing protein, partial [Pseudomonadota bacterium]